MRNRICSQDQWHTCLTKSNSQKVGQPYSLWTKAFEPSCSCPDALKPSAWREHFKQFDVLIDVRCPQWMGTCSERSSNGPPPPSAAPFYQQQSSSHTRWYRKVSVLSTTVESYRGIKASLLKKFLITIHLCYLNNKIMQFIKQLYST